MSQATQSDSADDSVPISQPLELQAPHEPAIVEIPAPADPIDQPLEPQALDDSPAQANDGDATPPAYSAADGIEYRRRRAQHYENRCSQLEETLLIHQQLQISKDNVIRECKSLIAQTELRYREKKNVAVGLKKRIRVLQIFFSVAVVVFAVVGFVVYGVYFKPTTNTVIAPPFAFAENGMAKTEQGAVCFLGDIVNHHLHTMPATVTSAMEERKTVTISGGTTTITATVTASGVTVTLPKKTVTAVNYCDAKKTSWFGF